MAAIKPDFHIGPSTPTRYASFTNSSPTWGSAIAQLGNTWAQSHAKRKTAEADRQLKSEQAQKRASWAAAIGQGASVRDIAERDPSIIADSAFLGFLDKSKAPDRYEDVLDDQGRPIAQRGPQGRTFAHPLAPEPEGPAAETWEDVASPHGFGGAAQRSSVSGKLINYQGAPTQPKGSDRRTAKDQTGRLRYLDTGEPAFADSLFDQGGTPPEADAPPLKDQLSMVRDLSADWQKTTRPMQGLLDSSDRMEIGLKMAQDGDMLAGSQAILISFNKLLDPTSVVRESEYARSATGQSALETMKGYADKIARGGAGVTESELQSYVRFGKQVVQKALESTVGPERKRIERLVEFSGVDPALIFSGRFAPGGQGVPQGAPQGLPQAAPRAPQALEVAPPQAQPQAPPLAQAPDPQAQASQTPGFAALAKALAGPPRAQAAPPPRAPAPATASMGPAPASPLAQQRIADYSTLKPDALKRQVDRMNANRADYSPEELRAAAMAWQRAFGE